MGVKLHSYTYTGVILFTTLYYDLDIALEYYTSLIIGLSKLLYKRSLPHAYSLRA